MAKTITFNYKDKDYTLEYTRKTIEAMEKQGLNIAEADKKPVTTMHQMFRGAFKCHHSSVSDATIDEIYDSIDDIGGVYQALVEMYQEAIETLSDDPNGETLGKIKWAVK